MCEPARVSSLFPDSQILGLPGPHNLLSQFLEEYVSHCAVSLDTKTHSLIVIIVTRFYPHLKANESKNQRDHSHMYGLVYYKMIGKNLSAK